MKKLKYGGSLEERSSFGQKVILAVLGSFCWSLLEELGQTVIVLNIEDDRKGVVNK